MSVVPIPALLMSMQIPYSKVNILCLSIYGPPDPGFLSEVVWSGE